MILRMIRQTTSRDFAAASLVQGLALACLLAAPATAQDPEVKDLHGQELTTESLVEALAAPGEAPPRMRGVEPSCEAYFNARTRGGGGAVAAMAAVEVLFEVGSDALTREARRNLDILGDALKSNSLSPCCFEIQGHTDNTGTDQLNQGLSERRARAVVDYLVANYRIRADRLNPVGYGESKPMATNDTDAGRRKNRRVQVVNLGYGIVSGG